MSSPEKSRLELLAVRTDGSAPLFPLPAGSVALRPVPLGCLLAALLAAGPARAQGQAFDFADVEFWVGSGSNRAGLVVDWHDGTRPHALAWGFRWDGTATGHDLWSAVTNADPGLTGAVTNGGVSALAGIEYVRPSAPGETLPGTGKHDVMHGAYTWDHTGAVFHGGPWSYWCSDGGSYVETNMSPCATGPSARLLADGSWDAWSFGEAAAPGWPAAALHYPFADAVPGYTPGSGVLVTPDWVSGELYTNVAVVLGRPAMDTTGDGTDIPAANVVPVVPVLPPSRAFELVMVGGGGSLTLQFDHRVLDNPSNPYGADFTVFGNAFQLVSGAEPWQNGDPSATLVGGTSADELALVSVSQDGTNWVAYTNGPYGDSFSPTLGRVHDPDCVDTNLGSWNAWWGFPTDPTLPLDPSVSSDDWDGMSVAAVSRRYRGGAGGTAFDIGDLDLGVDDNTGHRWIQFIRIERGADLNVEVDAVADVAPAAPHALWKQRHFAWLDDPASERDAADPDHDRCANLLEYGLAGDPRDGSAAYGFSASLLPGAASPEILVEHRLAAEAADADVEIVRTAALTAADWSTNGVLNAVSVSAASNGVRRVTATVPVSESAGFVRVRVSHDR